MPHKCVKCGKSYEDSSEVTVCDCGTKLFFYAKDKETAKGRFASMRLNEEQKKRIERDIYEIIGEELKEDSPVLLDIEAIHIKEPGKYELDLDKISSGEGLIYKFDEGKYIIDIAEAFNSVKKPSERDKRKR